MPLTIHAVPFGRPATERVAAVVASAQRADPLAPVTVVVPSNLAGIVVRRLLGSGAVGDHHRAGVANLTVATPHQLAAHLGAARASQGRIPLSNPVLAAAVRGALATEPGSLGPVASHPATEKAVVRLYGELSHLSEPTLDRLRREARPATADLLDLVHAVRSRLGAHYDEDDVARAAATAVAEGDVRELGAVVLYLVGDLTAAQSRLVAELARATEVTSIVGRTGDGRADRALRSPTPVDGEEATADRPTVTRIISTSDTDEEVRAVVRLIAGEADVGTPLDRIAVFYPVEEPYARTLHEQLDGAGIRWSGPATGRLAHTAAGRTLRRLLDLAEQDLGRQAVIDLVTGAPIRDRSGNRAPAARWDRISRAAGVVGGIEDWRSKLGSRIADLATRRDRAEAEADEAPARARRSELEGAESLLAFVEWLEEIRTQPSDATWRHRSERARFALDELLGAEHRRVRWPEDEQRAADAVVGALERVGGLDDLDPHPSAAVYQRAVAEELDAPIGRRGTIGTGVLLAPLAAAPGLDVEVAVVVGLAEGTCPTARNEDSLLPDADRALSAGELELRRDRVHRDHANLLAALAAGSRRRVMVHPRGDHRTGRTRLPSRWLLDAASALVGAKVTGSDHDEHRHPALQRVDSFVAGLDGPDPVASPADLDLRILARTGAEAVSAIGSPSALLAGLEAIRARRSPEFTRFDGNLAGVGLPSPVDGGPLSATRIESWAACPFRYQLGYVLDLAELERPERITEIGALDRGSLVHEVFERFGRRVLERPLSDRPGPGEPWEPDDRRRLLEVAEEVCDEYERRGVTGRPLLWRLTRRRLFADFERFLDHDDRLRAELGSTWEAVEVPFGMDGDAPVEIPLADGRTARFRGVIDRVDRRRDGDAVVIDYKTGKLRRESPYHELDDDPVVRGTRVQLPLYAEAVRQGHGATRPAGRYWFATADGEFTDLGYDCTDDRTERFREVVDLVVRNVEAGVFPARSGEFNPFWGTHDNCSFCEFDRLCPRDRDERWREKAEAPELAEYRSLAEPDAEPDTAEPGGSS